MHSCLGPTNDVAHLIQVMYVLENV